MKNKKKTILLLIVAILLIVFGVYRIRIQKQQDVYTEVAANGYVSGRNIEQVMFFYPSGIEPDLYLTQKVPSDYEKGKLVELVKDDTFSVCNPDKSIISVYKAKIKTENPSTKKLFSELERGTGIRVTNYSVTGKKKDGKTSKTILSVTAECMFSTDVYNDFTGKLAIVKRGKDVCYMFIGNTVNGKLSADDMTYMAKSLQYIDYQTAVNTDATYNSDATDTITISKDNPVEVGKYGKTYVINKTDHPKAIDAAVKVDEINQNAKSDIKDKLEESTIYKTLPDAEDGYTWQIAEISYTYLDHVVKEVKPYMNVRVVTDTNKKKQKNERIDLGRTYVLSDDNKADENGIYHMTIFYQAPEEYSLEIGDGNGDKDSKLLVEVDGSKSDK